MNKDDFDLLHQLSRDQTDLSFGLEDRSLGFFRKNARTKESIALFAEEQFVRKNDFDEMRCEMPGTPRSTFLMVFSPDGSKVASTHGNHNIYITDLRNGKNVKTLVGHPRTPWCIAFHPTSDQIVASGCLGGQVRIWDLSGGSEVWTTVNQSVIASLAFHPNDRVLAIATYNGIYFWDWSQPEPFVHAATYNIKEKVRFVAFDSLGHKLITGIANSPTTRWERVSAPVPVPRQERCASPYRRRITQRLVNNNTSTTNENPVVPTPSENIANISTRVDLSYPERERRITMCYRTLVREYEQLVKRYLQLYRPPTMIDRGTDPMEPNALINNSGTQTAEPQASTSGAATSAFVQHPRSGNSSSSSIQIVDRAGPSTSRSVTSVDPGPSTSGYAAPSTSGSSQIEEPPAGESAPVPSTSSQSPKPSNISPSRILSVKKKPDTLIRGTQTSESRKHKSADGHELKGKRLKKNDGSKSKGQGNNRARKNEEPNADNEQVSTPNRRLVVIDIEKLREGDQESAVQLSDGSSLSGLARSIRDGADAARQTDSRQTDPSPGSSRGETVVNSTVQSNVDELLSSIRRTAEQEVRKRILPIIRSVPADDRPELIRLFENSRERVRNSFRQRYPVVPRKAYGSLLNNLLSTTTDSSSSDDDLDPNTWQPRRNSEPSTLHDISSEPENPVSTTGASNSNPNITSAGNSSIVRNFNTELEQLVTSLLTEIERNETDNTEASENTNVNTQTAAAPAEEPQDVQLPADYSDHWMPWRTPLPPFSVLMASTSGAPTPPAPASSGSPLAGSLLFQEFIQVFQNRRPDPERLRDTSFEPPATVLNTNTNTTNSTVYTSSGGPANRRRFFSHRISAFMPTRVTYRRYPVSNFSHPNWRRSRTGTGQSSDQSFGIDELMNYSELENSEDESPPPPPPPDAEHPAEPATQPEPSIGDMYSNIVQELETSVENLVRMRITTRPGEASSMLTRFSESLDNILNQSAVILRNLSGSVEMLSAPTTARRYTPSEGSEPTTWSYFDPNFYVRDQRTDGLPPPDPSPDETINLSDIFSARPPFSAIESDHTYPRNPENALEPPPPETSNPRVATIHLTMVHIQRQAGILREQVDVIEQVDRAMLEVEQLQLVRRLTIELVRHVRRLSGESGPSTGGMSSVRQMMAGTRISDSSPYDLPAEDVTPAPTSSAAPPPPRPSSSRTAEAQPGSSSSSSSGTQPPTRSRANQRKTYPPSRLFRLARQCRRPSVWHFFSKRYSRATRQPNPAAPTPPRSPVRAPAPAAPPTVRLGVPAFTSVDADRLSLMTRRLEQLLNAQMRVFTAAEPARTNCRSIATIDLGEHILALRLHGCVLRMNRVLGHGAGSSTIGQLRADPTAAVSPDGMTRYGSRHLLSLVIDSVSRQIEELGTSNNIQQSTRMQIHGVLAMSLLLTELLLLIVVDSIPPPINPTPERTSLTSRIDQLCGQMLQNRQCTYSQQLTRSLRLMKSTMRQANSTLGQIYNARRSSMLPRHFTDRRLLLGSINRCLRAINRRRQSHDDDTDNTGPSSSSSNADWYSTMSDLIDQYSILNRDDDTTTNTNRPSTSTSRERAPRPLPNDVSFSSNNDNTDDDDADGFSVSTSSNSSNLYRTNNVNLAPARDNAPVRPWNVPAVRVNDVPVMVYPLPPQVSEPPGNLYAQRLISQRQRFAERVSELRSNPQMGLFRPRFLHPLYASVNPFDADLDDAQRDQIYDNDMITTVTPNHRIQAWDISDWSVPNIGSATRNIVVSECKIHNDASVDVAKDGTILVTLLPSGGYLNVTNRLGVYSLRWETLGQCLYTTSFERNAVSVSLSPLSRHLVVGLASRIVPSERWVMARVFRIDQKEEPGDRLPVIRELEQNQDCRINCIRWLPTSGQGLIYATNTGQLVVLT